MSCEQTESVHVERVQLADYRRDPVRYERLAGEQTRVVVAKPDGSTYATIGGRSVFDPARDL